MKDYFKRLKDHPGVKVATLMTAICVFVGAGNSTFSSGWYGAAFGFTISLIIWLMVLISNIKR